MNDVASKPHFGRFLKAAVLKRGGPTEVARDIFKNKISDQSLRRWSKFATFAEAKMEDANAERLAQGLGYASAQAFVEAAESMPAPPIKQSGRRGVANGTPEAAQRRLLKMLDELAEPLPVPVLVRLFKMLDPEEREEALMMVRTDGTRPEDLAADTLVPESIGNVHDAPEPEK